MRPAQILVVDDEHLIRWSLRQRLVALGHEVVEAEGGRAAQAAFAAGPHLMIVDYKLPDTDGLDLLRCFKADCPDGEVIMMTAHASVEMAVEAMRLGAFHYVSKPFDEESMLHLVGRALESSRMRRQIEGFRAQANQASFSAVIGESPAVGEIKSLATKVAASPASTVLLTGESGTGKGVLARGIHLASRRASAPFLNITCSALPETLLEAELFGHEKGAFTDARNRKLGLLELADGGTVFLDEIGELAPKLQAKLLGFLEDKSFRRVGGDGMIQVDVRVIAATNRQLETEVAEGRFREDLYYRLNVMPIRLPPLRERMGDLPLLVRHFVDQFNRELGRDVEGVSRAAMARLEQHPWPGNIRELRNAIERAMLLVEDRTIQPVDLMLPELARPSGSGFTLPAGGVDLAQLEREMVIQALERTGGNQTRAATLLGMNRDQIRYRLQKFELDAAQFGDGQAG